jgi:novel protein kinase C epsilon type
MPCENLHATVGYNDCGTCLQDHLFFVMEYVNGGDLLDFLDEIEVFSEKWTQFYAAQVTLALQFLHKHGILHR